METTQVTNAEQTTEKKFNYPLSASVKNALTGASINGFDAEKNQVEVRMADASYLKLQVADKTAEFLKNNPDMPKLQIQDVKNHSLQLGKTFIELTPDAVKYLNSKYQDKSIKIPETLKINGADVTFSDEQRAALGAGKTVNIGKVGTAKEEQFIMVNPNDTSKMLVMKATKEVPRYENKQNAAQSETTAEPTKKAEQRVRKAPAVKGPGL